MVHPLLGKRPQCKSCGTGDPSSSIPDVTASSDSIIGKGSAPGWQSRQNSQGRYRKCSGQFSLFSACLCWEPESWSQWIWHFWHCHLRKFCFPEKTSDKRTNPRYLSLHTTLMQTKTSHAAINPLRSLTRTNWYWPIPSWKGLDWFLLLIFFRNGEGIFQLNEKLCLQKCPVALKDLEVSTSKNEDQQFNDCLSERFLQYSPSPQHLKKVKK